MIAQKMKSTQKIRVVNFRILFYVSFLLSFIIVGGCGKKGALEAPLRKGETVKEGETRKKEDARRPVTVPDRSFPLDPLL